MASYDMASSMLINMVTAALYRYLSKLADLEHHWVCFVN